LHRFLALIPPGSKRNFKGEKKLYGRFSSDVRIEKQNEN
jgi:hypothetical protein